jgi:hypothetical protein
VDLSKQDVRCSLGLVGVPTQRGLQRSNNNWQSLRMATCTIGDFCVIGRLDVGRIFVEALAQYVVPIPLYVDEAKPQKTE